MSIAEFIKSSPDYFENYITRSTYNSNAIEGNTLSYAQTYAIIFNDNSFKVTAQPREIYEAINHKYALSYILDNLDEPLSEDMIKHIGITINKNINEISGYRTSSVFIRGAQHIPPAPNMLSQQMMYFVYNYNNTVYDNVFNKLAAKHIEFERIHPFSDGNGRTGRLLLNYELLKNDIPPVIIPVEQRTQYFDYIATDNEKGLSDMFRNLSEQEYELLKTYNYSSKIL